MELNRSTIIDESPTHKHIIDSDNKVTMIGRWFSVTVNNQKTFRIAVLEGDGIGKEVEFRNYFY